MLYENEPVLDDDSSEEAHAAPDGYGKGWTGPDEHGYGDAVSAFPQSLMIDPSEFQARIQEREANGWQLSQQMLAANLPCHNQQSTEFCWGNAVVHTGEITRVKQNEPMVILSPASICAPLTGFRNVGGFDRDAITRMATVGAVPAANWPVNAISKQYFTRANIAIAANYKIDQWIGISAGQQNQITSLLLQGIPVAVGLPWWEHEITLYDAVWLNNRLAWRGRNSWGMQYGSNGFFLLQGSKMQYGTAVAPFAVSTSA